MINSRGKKVLLAGALGLAALAIGAGVVVQVGADEPEARSELADRFPAAIEANDLQLGPDNPGESFYEDNERGRVLADQLATGWAPIDGLPDGSLVFAPIGFIGSSEPGAAVEAVDAQGEVVGIVFAPTVFVPMSDYLAPSFDWREAVRSDYAEFPERADAIIATIEANGGVATPEPAIVAE